MYRKFVVCLLIISVLFLSGCWDRQEPDDLVITIGAGIDYNPETDMYKLSFEFVNSLAAQGGEGGGGGSEKPDYWVVSAWGHTILDAVSNIRKKVSREIYYAHMNLELISEEMVKTKGIIPVLEATERTRQSRSLIMPVIVNGDVEEMLAENIPIESSNVRGLINQIQLTNREIASTISDNTREFINKLSKPGIEPVAASLELIKEQKETEESKPKENMPPPVVVKKIAVFKGDKMAGWLKERETRGYNWVMGAVERANLTFEYSGDNQRLLTVLVNKSDGSFEPIIKNGKPSIKINVQVNGKIVNITGGSSNLKEESQLISSLKSRLAQVVHNDIEIALDKTQSLKADIFGFGNSFYRLKYNKWQDMEDDWRKIFASLPVEIEVKADIKRTGLINKGIKPR